MNFQQIFNEYYTLYRGDSAVPDPTDPEWAIAVRFGNTALRRLQEVDTEQWEWLWTNTLNEGATLTYGTSSTSPTTTQFACPTNMVRPGGWVQFSDASGNPQFAIDVIASYNVQRMASAAPYAYFTGSAQKGFTLNVSLVGNSYIGYQINFPYYKSITMFNATSDGNGGVRENGNTVTECPDANYIINYILAYRYRSSRNYPSYQTAKSDAETALQGMQQKNRMGVDGHPANLLDSDNSGTFGS